MSRKVPVLDFIHELRTAGQPADFYAVLNDPQGQWERLPAERRVAILRKHGAKEGSTSDLVVRAVRRRARIRTVENVFLDLQPRIGANPLARLGTSVLYAPFVLPPETNATPLADAAIKDAGWTRGHGDILTILDSLWSEGRYDAALDGSLVDLSLPKGYAEVERYWVHEPFALVAVLREPSGELIYHVEEPRLTDLERVLLATINDRIRDTLIAAIDKEYRAEALASEVFELLRMYRPNADRRTAYKLAYFLLRNYLAMGPIEPIMRDEHIEDVSCNGPGLPVYVAHNRHQSLRTNLSFDELELNSFTIKLAQRGGKLLSIAQPLVDATLPDGSRLQAALGREVTSRGSAFTIRKFREDPLTAVDLIRMGTHSLDTMAFLWLAVEMRRSLLVMGATASGKTTTLNCLSQFIPPAVKIVSIEDTREITLQHENWLAAVTRESFTGGNEGIGMFDLLRAALRQRPEYLIVGEIRGQEGLTLFQAMSTGHTCFSTMHAGSVENAVYRLENAPINVPRVMLTSLDFFLLQGQVDVGGRSGRRMISLTELGGVDPQTRNLRMNEVFKWDPTKDETVASSSSYVMEQARARLGWTRERLEEDLATRRRILGGLVERNERHYTDVAKAVRAFYNARAAEGEARQIPVDTGATQPAPPGGKRERRVRAK